MNYRDTRTVFCDLDDTLIECGIYYADAIERGAALIESCAGLNRRTAEKLIRQVDLLALEHDGSFAKERFPNSFAAAMCAAFEITGAHRGDMVGAVNAALDAGWSVFDAPYKLKPGAEEFLEWAVRGEQLRLVLVTKGDYEIQRTKVAKNGIARYFESIEVVPKKDVETWRAIVDKWISSPALGYVVGDSLRDDIAPATQLGLCAIHMRPSLHWAFNDHDVRPTVQVGSFEELRQVFLTRG